MTEWRASFSIILMLLAAYIVVLNWGCVIVSERNRPPTKTSLIRKRNFWRWVIFAFWTAVIFYSMDIFKPTESQIVGMIKEWFVQHGLPERAPDKLYHGWSFVAWSILLAGAVARGYLTILSRRQLYICILTLILFVGLPEGLQHFNPTRVPSWSDVGINLSGGVVGLVCQVTIAHIWTSRMNKD
ncbi:MAG: VanZ family protein [Planctomycetota bacterium]